MEKDGARPGASELISATLPSASRRAAWVALLPYLPAAAVTALASGTQPAGGTIGAPITFACLYCCYAMLYGALLVAQLTTGSALRRVLVGLLIALITALCGLAAVLVFILVVPFLMAATVTAFGIGQWPSTTIFLLGFVGVGALFGALTGYALRAFARWPRSDPARVTIHRLHIATATASAAFAAVVVGIMTAFPVLFDLRSTILLLIGAVAGPLSHAVIVSAWMPATGGVNRPVRRASLRAALVTLIIAGFIPSAAWIWAVKDGDAVARRVASVLAGWR